MVAVFWNSMKWYIVFSWVISFLIVPVDLYFRLKNATEQYYLFSKYTYIFLLIYLLVFAVLFYYPYIISPGNELLSLYYNNISWFVFLLIGIGLFSGIPIFILGIGCVENLLSFILRFTIIAMIFLFSFFVIIIVTRSLVWGIAFYSIVCLFPLIPNQGEFVFHYFLGEINPWIVIAAVVLMFLAKKISQCKFTL